MFEAILQFGELTSVEVIFRTEKKMTERKDWTSLDSNNHSRLFVLPMPQEQYFGAIRGNVMLISQVGKNLLRGTQQRLNVILFVSRKGLSSSYCTGEPGSLVWIASFSLQVGASRSFWIDVEKPLWVRVVDRNIKWVAKEIWCLVISLFSYKMVLFKSDWMSTSELAVLNFFQQTNSWYVIKQPMISQAGRLYIEINIVDRKIQSREV